MVFSLLKDAVEFIDDHRHIKGGKPRNGEDVSKLHVTWRAVTWQVGNWLVGWLVGFDLIF